MAKAKVINMFKRILSVFLILCILGSAVTVAVFADDETSGNDDAPAASCYDGTADTSWYQESETEFTLLSAAQLAGLAKLVNEQGKNFAGKTVKLGCDIVWNKGTIAFKDDNTLEYLPVNGESVHTWTPIGKFGTLDVAGVGANSFQGSFDGQYHTVSGLWFNDGSRTGGGLFNLFIGKELKNLSVVNSGFNSQSRTAPFAAVVMSNGQDRVTLENLYSECCVRTLNKYAAGAGLVGAVIVDSGKTVDILRCWANSEVFGKDWRTVSGFVGMTKTNASDNAGIRDGVVNISDCLMSGSVTSAKGSGNIAGLIIETKIVELNITNTVVAGKVKGGRGMTTGADGGAAFLMIQEVGKTITDSAMKESAGLTLSFKNCYYRSSEITNINSTPYPAVNQVNTNASFDQDAVTDIMSDEDIDIRGVSELYWDIGNDEIRLNIFSYIDPSSYQGGGEDEGGEETNVYRGNYDTTWYNADSETREYTITKAAELAGLAKLVNRGDADFSGWTIRLGADIIWNDGAFDENGLFTKAGATESSKPYKWTPIGSRSSIDDRWETTKPPVPSANTHYFKGTFDGQGHSVSGLYYKANNYNAYIGLFSTFCGPELKNLKILNSYFSSRNGIGSFAGSVCIFEDSDPETPQSVKLSNLYSDAYIRVVSDSMFDECGGIVGYVQIRSSGKVNTVSASQCWFNGTLDAGLTGNTDGGIIGSVFGYWSGEIDKSILSTKNKSKIDAERMYQTKMNVTSYVLDMKDCLMSGKMIAKAGLCGGIVGEVSNIKLKAENCLVTGVFEGKQNPSTTSGGNDSWGSGAIVNFNSRCYGEDTRISEIYNCYYIKNNCYYTFSTDKWVLPMNGCNVLWAQIVTNSVECKGIDGLSKVSDFSDAVWSLNEDAKTVGLNMMDLPAATFSIMEIDDGSVDGVPVDLENKTDPNQKPNGGSDGTGENGTSSETGTNAAVTPEKSGCGSSVGYPGLILLAIAGMCLPVRTKRKGKKGETEAR